MPMPLAGHCAVVIIASTIITINDINVITTTQRNTNLHHHSHHYHHHHQVNVNGNGVFVIGGMFSFIITSSNYEILLNHLYNASL